MIFNWLCLPTNKLFLVLEVICSPDICGNTYMPCNGAVECEGPYSIQPCNGNPNISYGSCVDPDTWAYYTDGAGPPIGKSWICQTGHVCNGLTCGGNDTGDYTCNLGVLCGTHTGSCIGTGCETYS